MMKKPVAHLILACALFMIMTSAEAGVPHTPASTSPVATRTPGAALPLVITPATTQQSSGNTMAVMLCGDGGWSAFDQQVAGAFAANGIPVAGLNSLKYFWTAKTPAQTLADVETIIRTYQARWKKDKVILIGYSFGADVLPFVYNQLSAPLRDNVLALSLLSPSARTDFEIHVSEMLHWHSRDQKYDVYDALKQVRGLRPVCFYGRQEKNIPTFLADKVKFRLVMLDGGHHYENAVDTIVKTTLDDARENDRQTASPGN